MLDFLINQLENARNPCLRKKFGVSSRSLIKVILHLTKLLSIQEHIHILQDQFLFQSTILHEDTLLVKLLFYLQTAWSNSQWCKVAKIPHWSQRISQLGTLTINKIKSAYYTFLRDHLLKWFNGQSANILSQCRSGIGTNTILWLSMTRLVCDRCLHWRSGWLLVGSQNLTLIIQIIFSQNSTQSVVFICIVDYKCLSRSLILCLSCWINYLRNLFYLPRKLPLENSITRYLHITTWP